MKVKVNKDLCIGCGACQAIASDVFQIDDDGLAEVIDNNNINDDNVEDVVDALEGCPTNAIEDITDKEDNINDDEKEN